MQQFIIFLTFKEAITIVAAMLFIKLGILLVGFTYAGILPYSVKKTLQHMNFDMSVHSLSFLSNKDLFDKKYVKAYTRLLFATAILNYFYFWLLSKHYDLGDNEVYMRQTAYCFAFLTLLAFMPHNIHPYSLKYPARTFRRLMHNILGGLVFLMLPALIVIFQVSVIADMFFLGLTGLIIVSGTFLITLWSLFRTGINGITEMFFINGISIWTIYVTIFTFLQ